VVGDERAVQAEACLGRFDCRASSLGVDSLDL